MAIGVELLMLSINSIAAVHSLWSRGPYRTLQLYLPIAFTAAVVDNVVIHAGYLHYDSGYLLWVGDVPVSVALSWGTIVYVMQTLRWRDVPRTRQLLPLGSGLAAGAAILDAIVERYIPSTWLGWTWLINNPALGFPARNSIGWFMILFSSLIIQDYSQKRRTTRSVRLLVSIGLSVIQTIVIVLALVLLGYVID